MRKFFPQGGDINHEFHGEDEGELRELVEEFEKSEETKEIKEKVTGTNFCDLCKKKFRSRYHLKLHMPVHTGEKNYDCGICKKSYQQKWNLITHMDRVHAKEKPFKCTECTKSFGYSSHFKRHIKTHFVEKMQVPEEIKRKILNPFSCKHCSKIFDSNYRLRLHTEKHTANGLFICDKCGLSFKTKTAINNHLSQHDNEDGKCDKSYKSPDHGLSGPRRSRIVQKLFESTKLEVTNTKSYKLSPLRRRELIPCEVCGKTMMKESMNKHLNIHYRSRVYKCQYCGKEFLESSQRTIHERRHTGEKPYLCDFCGKRHSQYGNLLTHLMTNHKSTNNRKSRTCNNNKSVPVVNPPNEEGATVKRRNDDDVGSNNPIVLSSLEQIRDETREKSKEVRTHKRLKGSERAKINTAENPEILSACIPDTEECGTVTENVTEDNDDLISQEPDSSYTQTFDLAREVRKRMNSNIFEKIVEDFDATTGNAEVKFLVEDIRNVSSAEDKDPLKEFLKLMKSVPVNTVVKRVDGKMRWFCWICNSVFANRHILARHLIIHEPKEGRPFKCDHCQKTFTQSNNYKEHLMSHNNENQFYCEKCGCGFRHKSHFNNHLRRHSESASQEKPKKFQCSHCDKKFHTNFHREEHTRTHTREKPYLCKACGAQFSALSTLNRHSAIHTNAQHQCQICLKLFKQKSSLKRHAGVHAGDCAKRVTCECGKSFSQKSCLTKHRMICKSRGEPVAKPFDCSLCSKRFLTRSDLKRHSATHDTSKKYKCDVCFVSLKTWETYARHVRRHKESVTR